MPKISFVVPVHNKESYIAECLESLTQQNLGDIEIVVVDDCSTDDSLEIARYMASKNDKIKVYALEQNRGRSYTRNYGNEKATADIICVQDADDIALPDRAGLTYDYFQKNDIDVFYGSFHVSNAMGEVHETVAAIPFDIEKVVKTTTTFIGHSTMAYKKSAVADIKYSDGKWSELGLDDFKLQMDLYKKGYKFGYTDQPLMVYRQLTDSISAVRSAVDVYKQKGEYLASAFSAHELFRG